MGPRVKITKREQSGFSPPSFLLRLKLQGEKELIVVDIEEFQRQLQEMSELVADRKVSAVRSAYTAALGTLIGVLRSKEVIDDTDIDSMCNKMDRAAVHIRGKSELVSKEFSAMSLELRNVFDQVRGETRRPS